MENLLENNKINVYDYTTKTKEQFRALLDSHFITLNELDVNEIHYLVCQNIIKTTELDMKQLVELYSRAYLDPEELEIDQLLELMKYI